MSRLTSYFFSDGADDDPITPVVESYPLNELRPAAAMHTYPPQPVISASLDPRTSATPSSPATSLGDEFGMDLFDNPWGTARRKRDDDDQPPNKIFLKEVDQSSRLRDDVRELHFSKHDLLLRKRQIQANANSQESNLRSVIAQYQERQGFLERGKADALTSLNENHHNELANFQNRMVLGIRNVAKKKLLAEKEAELARLAAGYSSKIASLDSQMRQANIASSSPSLPSWRHVVGKRPVATCTNIVGFSIIPDASSDSDRDESPQTSAPPLTSLLSDVPIQNATVGMLVEALAKVLLQTAPPRAARSRLKTHETPIENFTDAQRQNNKANVRELFYTAFHFAKDDEYMLHVTASSEAISCFTQGLGTGPDPLELHWDMTTTHNSKWNQRVIDILCSQYTCTFETNRLASRSPQSIKSDITKKFNQCRSSWRKAQPRVLGDGTRETMKEKFETRKKVTSALLSDRIATGKDDQAVWVYLQSLVETLGKDGMSSDESEHEDGEVQVFRLKKMPWRADVDHEMHIIDQQRLAGAANFTPHGSKPAKRFRNAIQESSRPAIKGLPRALYNSSWLNAQSPSFTVSDKKLQRMEIILSR
ncbi:hypothetical protein EV702DRAFT_1046623 [Suillus placidus]|uniref:Uncharacterized protein n=1 Tax=Suillus placidus TaxID=48579 RepID=A0A9P6ZSK9_9AGAM|nr:hypothetical protein EV702DRAFT_1046623 [Suillus placidus]